MFESVSGQNPTGQKPIGQIQVSRREDGLSCRHGVKPPLTHSLNIQADKIQGGHKPRGTKSHGDKSPGGQYPSETKAQGDKSPGGQNPTGTKTHGGQYPSGQYPRGTKSQDLCICIRGLCLLYRGFAGLKA